MTKSLQEQLLKAGLVNKQQLGKSKKEQSKKRKKNRNSRNIAVDEDELQAKKALKEKTRHDRDLNIEQNRLAKEKAIAAQIGQLIKANELTEKEDGEAYNFTYNSKIKTLYISEDTRKGVAGGRLAIVKHNERYSVVPSKVAEKIRERDQNIVVVLNSRTKNENSENDDYAGYQIPDDLMW